MYEIRNKKGETVASARSYTFAASLKSVLERETKSKYDIEVVRSDAPMSKYRICLFVEYEKTITVQATSLAEADDAIRLKARESFGTRRTRVDWKATRAANTPMSSDDTEFLNEISD